MKAELLLRLASLTYLGLVAAGLTMPKVTGLWAQVGKLSPFAQGLFRTYYVFIGFCLVSFGLGSWFLAEELASGTLLARAVCGFLGVFWLLRLGSAIWLIDVGPYLRNIWWRIAYHVLNLVFAILPFLYLWVAFKT